MDEMIKLIANVGFPIAIAVYLLVRVESRVTILTQAITELREAILVMPREQPQVVYPPARIPLRDGL